MPGLNLLICKHEGKVQIKIRGVWKQSSSAPHRDCEKTQECTALCFDWNIICHAVKKNEGAGFPGQENNDITSFYIHVLQSLPVLLSRSPTTKQLTNDDVVDVVFYNSSEWLTNVNPTERARVGSRGGAYLGVSASFYENANQKELKPTQILYGRDLLAVYTKKKKWKETLVMYIQKSSKTTQCWGTNKSAFGNILTALPKLTH